ncbi:MAG: hypothetical protein ACK5OX_16245 [Desertimonas sp.]
MSDDPDAQARASDDLDGELPERDRAAIGDRRAHQELVGAMGRVRDELADVDPPTVDARERAIAAALGVYDDQRQPDGVPPPPPPALAERRARRAGRASRWLAPVAAAAVTVVAIGGAITMFGGNDGDDTAGSADVTFSVAADDGARNAAEAAETEAAPAPGAVVVADDDAPSDAAVVAAPTTPASSLPIAHTDDELLAIATAALDTTTARVCDRDIVATVIDARTVDRREVLLAIEQTAGVEFVVVIAPADRSDGCRVLDRVAID